MTAYAARGLGLAEFTPPCPACGRNVYRDPWPHGGILCGHCDLESFPSDAPEAVRALAAGMAPVDAAYMPRCPVCGSVVAGHECHGGTP